MAQALDSATDDAARALTDLRALTTTCGSTSGALWRLTEPGRQLDANLIRLVPRQRVEHHVEPDLDVMLLVTGRDGTLRTTEGSLQLAEGALLWMPRGASRSVRASDGGLVYLTVHRRRPGMQIRHHAPED